MKHVEAIDTTEKHFTLCRLIPCVLFKGIVLKAITNIIIAANFRDGVEFRNAFVRTKPEIAMLIFQNAIDYIIGQTIFFRISPEAFGSLIVAIQTVVGTHPYIALTVLHDRKNDIEIDAVLVARIVTMVNKLVVFSVKEI
jgi:hypothetical protein